jgi:hypothetical protein
MTMNENRYEWLHPHWYSEPALAVLAAAEQAAERGHRAAGETAGAVWDDYAAAGVSDEQMALGMMAVASQLLHRLQALEPGVDHLAAHGLGATQPEPVRHENVAAAG